MNTELQTQCQVLLNNRNANAGADSSLAHLRSGMEPAARASAYLIVLEAQGGEHTLPLTPALPGGARQQELCGLGSCLEISNKNYGFLTLES